MKVGMLRSQLDTLEPLREDEPGIVLDIDQPVSVLVDQAAERLRAEEPA
jgi:gluconokinase